MIRNIVSSLIILSLFLVSLAQAETPGSLPLLKCDEYYTGQEVKQTEKEKKIHSDLARSLHL